MQARIKHICLTRSSFACPTRKPS